VERLRRHPLARALRLDKTTIAGLEATLRSYVTGRALEELPVWRMIAAPLDGLRARAEAQAAELRGAGLDAAAVACRSAVGGGSLPGETLPSAGVALPPGERGAEAIAGALRAGEPAVAARIADDRLLFDLRTVPPGEDAALGAAIRRACEAGEPGA
jgi:L-seryl-tRNA(Ser) seleniumtransferase